MRFGFTRTCLFLFIVWAGCGRATEIDIVVRALPLVARDDVQSFELWVFDARKNDGTSLGCEELLSRATVPTDSKLRPLRDPILGNLEGDPVQIDAISPGRRNRTFYVDLFDATQGLGRRIGAGCAEEVSIEVGKETTVRLQIGEGELAP
jgi:hypothetical protein